MALAAEVKLRELYEVHDSFYPASGTEKQARLSELAADVVREVDLAERDTLSKAQAAYLRGKALNALDSYSQEAEEHLARAVKLNPTNSDAWNALGVCFWKKGDYAGAKNCFIGGLEQGKNADSLRRLSMVLRRLGSSAEERTANLAESLRCAREAVALDVNDGESWYMLGNALTTQFFAATHDPEDLRRALSAYQRAARLCKQPNPDLFFNRGNVRRYLMELGPALSDYGRAMALDPGFEAAEEAGADARRMVVAIARAVETKCRIKPKRLASLARSLPTDAASLEAARAAVGKRTVATLAQLRPGPNRGVVLPLRMLMPVSRPEEPPVSFAMLDSRGDCAVVAVYHLDARRAPELAGSSKLFVVVDPTLRVVAPEAGGDAGDAGDAGEADRAEREGKEDGEQRDARDDERKVPSDALAADRLGSAAVAWKAFALVQVLRPEQFLVEGRPLSAAFAAEGVRVEHFDS